MLGLLKDWVVNWACFIGKTALLLWIACSKRYWNTRNFVISPLNFASWILDNFCTRSIIAIALWTSTWRAHILHCHWWSIRRSLRSSCPHWRSTCVDPCTNVFHAAVSFWKSSILHSTSYIRISQSAVSSLSIASSLIAQCSMTFPPNSFKRFLFSLTVTFINPKRVFQSPFSRLSHPCIK